MLRYVLRRVLGSIPLIFIVTFGVFVMIDLAPGDISQTLAGENATPELLRAIRRELGLNRPLLTRYFDWLGHAITGDLGHSLKTHEAISSMIGDRVEATLSIVLVSMLIAALVGGIMGIAGALKPRSARDRALTTSSSLLVSAPPHWIGLILVAVFAISVRWLPATGYSSIKDGLWDWFRFIILPSIALAGVPIAEVARQLRGSVVDVMGQDYVLTARAKGLRKFKVVAKHGLKNAAIPVVTVFGYRFAVMLGGTAVVELVFNIHGIGFMIYDAVLSRDVPVVLGLTVFFTLGVILVNLLVDLTYGYLNPKVRQQ